jgi:hypothetical protein
MARESWVGTRVKVYFVGCPWIEGTVERTPADAGDTWYIVGDHTNYAVQSFAYIEAVEKGQSDED